MRPKEPRIGEFHFFRVQPTPILKIEKVELHSIKG